MFILVNICEMCVFNVNVVYDTHTHTYARTYARTHAHIACICTY